MSRILKRSQTTKAGLAIIDRVGNRRVSIPTTTSALIEVVRLADPALMVEIECMAVISTERFRPVN